MRCVWEAAKRGRKRGSRRNVEERRTEQERGALAP